MTIKVLPLQSCNLYIVLICVFIYGCNSLNGTDGTERPSRSVVFGQPVLNDSIVFDRKKGVALYHNKLFTGTAISYYDNDSVATSIDFLEGKRHGQYKKWFEDGNLCFKASYSNGKRHGRSYSWRKNGNLRSESYFISGVAEGEQLQFYQGGHLFKRINLIHGLEEGIQQSWRENGKLYNNYEAKNGRIFGFKRSKLCFKLNNE
ncbi:MAG: toxin-antitoxin system YwqK family antitoxin [Bacteroidota bacterium]